MEQLRFGDGLTRHPQLHRLTQQASEVLRNVIGTAGEGVTAEWDRGEDARGRSLLFLRLSDFSGSVSAVFEPQELESTLDLRLRLYGLWGDLLKIRSHWQLQEMLRGDEGQEGN